MKENNLQSPQLFSNLSKEWAVLQNYITAVGGSVHAFQRIGETLEPVLISRTDNNALMVRPENRGLSGFQYGGLMDRRGDAILIPHDDTITYLTAYNNWLNETRKEKYSYTDTVTEEELEENPYLSRLYVYFDQCNRIHVEATHCDYIEPNHGHPPTFIFDFATEECYQDDVPIGADDWMQSLLFEGKGNFVEIDPTIYIEKFNPATVSDTFNAEAFLRLNIIEQHDIKLTHDEVIIFLEMLYAKFDDAKPERWDETREALQKYIDLGEGLFNIKMMGTVFTSPLYEPSLVNLPETSRELNVFEMKFSFHIYYEGK